MQRTTRLLVAALVVVAGIALVVVGAAPRAVATVSEAAALEPGREVEVRGTVKPGTVRADASPVSFVVTDGVRDLPVTWDRPLPEHEAGGTLEGRLALVAGVVERGPDGPVLRATDIRVGCASKYEV